MREAPPPPLACPRLAAVRSPATRVGRDLQVPPEERPVGRDESGNRPERFLAASSVCAIRDARMCRAGACRDGRRSK